VAGSREFGEATFGDVERFAAEARVDEAARTRARRASLVGQAEEEATLRGVLVDLGERAAVVRLELDAGRSVVGEVQRVGLDHVMVRTRDVEVLVALSAVGAVLPEAAEHAVTGARAVHDDTNLRTALELLAADRPTVLLRLRSGATVQGELRAVGLDIVALVLDGTPRRRGAVSLGALAEVWPWAGAGS
jgi:hypothetical protein